MDSSPWILAYGMIHSYSSNPAGVSLLKSSRSRPKKATERSPAYLECRRDRDSYPLSLDVDWNQTISAVVMEMSAGKLPADMLAI